MNKKNIFVLLIILMNIEDSHASAILEDRLSSPHQKALPLMNQISSSTPLTIDKLGEMSVQEIRAISPQSLTPKEIENVLDMAFHYGFSRDDSDDEKEAALYKIAAEAGDVRAQGTFAELLALGKGVKRDYKGSLEWYCKAAENGERESADYLIKLLRKNLLAKEFSLDEINDKDYIVEKEKKIKDIEAGLAADEED